MDPQVREDIYMLHAQICKALADAKRLLILNALRDTELTVGDLASSLELPQATVSQHLAILRQRSLVSSRRNGVNVFYKIANKKVIKAFDLLRDVMTEQLAKEQELHEAYRETAASAK
jgi:ArsR family transcriptional regulator